MNAIRADCPVCGGVVITSSIHGGCCGLVATKAAIEANWPNAEPLDEAGA